jgi:hypothetical protein
VSRSAFVAERASHAVAASCRIVGASVSGSYARLREIPAVQARAEAGLRDRIGRGSAAGRRSTARPGSTPGCAGGAGATPAGAWRG